MLFKLSSNTPRFRVFELLNEELLFFISQAVADGIFQRHLFTQGVVGQACWDNSNENDQRANSDLTREKFQKFFIEFQRLDNEIRVQLNAIASNNQNLQRLFLNPQREQLNFLPTTCFTALKNLSTHLYCATKDLQAIINAAGGLNLNSHFENFRADNANGNICKACGLSELAHFRAQVPDGDQWRADYDHLLCKSKYPLYSVHPDNLIPLCTTCNQDAKKAKDLFASFNGQPRLSFYPLSESAISFVDMEIEKQTDPEPEVRVKWIADDADIIVKLDTWDDVYEIKRRVEGKFKNLELLIIDLINPVDYQHLVAQVSDKARPLNQGTYKRLSGAFWDNTLFRKLDQISLESIWAKIEFLRAQGRDGGDYILENQ